MVGGASPDEQRGMWRVLFVYLGWAVQAEHETLHNSAGSSSSSSALATITNIILYKL
jgi:hypothetical protein